MGMITPSHFVPLAAPGMVALGLKWMWNPESPFYIEPRLDWDLFNWAFKFWQASTAARVNRAAPLLRDLNLASRACFQELDDTCSGRSRREVAPTSQSAVNQSLLTSAPTVTLPPAGWAAVQENVGLFTYSALNGTNKVDYLRSTAYTYLDGRGEWFSTPEAASNGAVAISRLERGALQVVRISGRGPFIIRRPYQTRGPLTVCDAFDVEGNRLSPPVCRDNGQETRIEPVEKAVKYMLRFGGKL